jgi:putative ABC transport system permease protein
MLARIASLPGMESAASANCPPLGSDCIFMPVTRVDARATTRGEYPPMEVHVVSRDYLRTLRVPLRRGRVFDSREAPGRPTAVIVNESAARLLWRGQSAVGRRLSTLDDSTPSVEVVGVVADVKYEAITAPARPAVYYDAGQFSSGGGSVIVARARTSPTDVLPAIRRVITGMDPTMAVFGVATGEEVVARAASSTRFVTMLLSGFGLGAALLAALGVYGVLAYLVTQRRREFGIRIAIGAQPSSVLALVARQGVGLTVIGVVIGVGGAVAATRLLSGFLYGVERTDVPTYAVIVALVGTAGVLATLIPAVRATRVDPISALRE